MKRILFFALCFSLVVPGYAAKPQQIEWTSTYVSNDRNESQAQAEQHAIERAKQKALEHAFGVDVSSIVVSMEQESSQNGTYNTDESFFSLGGTSVRGEWITTSEERILSSVHNGEYWEVKAFVAGTIREKTSSPIDLQYAIISQPTDRETRPRFYDGEDLLLRFSSPVDGALCVYLVDESKTAYCLLPYMNESKGYAAVKANSDTLFFSRTTNPQAQDLVFTAEKEVEHNVLYIVFSPNRFTKARDQKGGANWREQALPRSLAYADFLRWLAKNQTADEQMTVRTEIIEIRK